MMMFAHNATTMEVKIRNSRPAWGPHQTPPHIKADRCAPQTHTFMLLVNVFLTPDCFPHPWQVS